MTISKRIRLIYSIVLSAALIIAGLCLMAACVNIYSSGDRPFSREAVAEQFSGIAIPVYLALALTIGSFLLELFLPAEDHKRKADKNYGMILKNLWKKRDLNSAPLPLRDSILAQQKRRKVLSSVSAGLLALCSMLFLFFGANPTNFSSSDINGSIVNAVILMLACLAIPFGFAVFAAYSTRRSLQKEIELVKQIPPGEAVNRAGTHDYTPLLRWSLLAAAVVLITYGYFAGGTVDVLTKAVNICTECVGLG